MVKDIGPHIASRVEQAFGPGNFYNHAAADQVLAHYRGVLEGLGLADARTLKEIDKLQNGVATARNQQEFFDKEVKPFFLSLHPAGVCP